MTIEELNELKKVIVDAIVADAGAESKPEAIELVLNLVTEAFIDLKLIADASEKIVRALEGLELTMRSR